MDDSIQQTDTKPIVGAVIDQTSDLYKENNYERNLDNSSTTVATNTGDNVATYDVEISNNNNNNGGGLMKFNDSNISHNTTILNQHNGFENICAWLSSIPWPSSESINHSLKLLSSIAMVVGCILPYVPQYIHIYKTRNCDGFSTFVCLALLIANILRIGFWFGKPFDEALLIQSILMIMAMILLMELCIRTKRRAKASKRKHYFLSKEYKYFWRWTAFTSYLEFLCIFSLVLALVVYKFKIDDYKIGIEIIGFLSAIIESMLGLPQLITNFRKKSTLGMSVGMVLMWLFGDLFKTAYYIINDTPKQFWLCGSLQVTIDLLIMLQIFIYRGRSPADRVHQVDLEKETSPKFSLT